MSEFNVKLGCSLPPLLVSSPARCPGKVNFLNFYSLVMLVCHVSMSLNFSVDFLSSCSFVFRSLWIILGSDENFVWFWIVWLVFKVYICCWCGLPVFKNPWRLRIEWEVCRFCLYDSNTVCYCWINFEIFQACFPPVHSDGFKNMARNAYESSIFLEFLPIIVVCFFLFESLWS